MLDPATGAKYASVLAPVRNAQAVNRGAMPVDAVGVAAPDPLTVVIQLEQPTPYFVELMTHQASTPVHRPSLARFGEAFTRPGNLVSNGAYLLRDFSPNDRITAIRNPHYREAGRVAIPQVEYIPTPDLAAAVRRFAAGEIDSLDDLPADQVRSLKSRFGDAVVLNPALGVLALMVNVRKRPLDDARVRRALSLALDREFLAEAVWGETMLPAYSLTPAGLDNALPPPTMPGRDLSPLEREDAAVALLREAGYGPGAKPLAVELRTNITEGWAFKWLFMYESGRLSQILGLSLVGMLLGRIGFFARPEAFARARPRALLVALACALALYLGREPLAGLVPATEAMTMPRALTGAVLGSLFDLAAMAVLMLGFTTAYYGGGDRARHRSPHRRRRIHSDTSSRTMARSVHPLCHRSRLTASAAAGAAACSA